MTYEEWGRADDGRWRERERERERYACFDSGAAESETRQRNTTSPFRFCMADVR